MPSAPTHARTERLVLSRSTVFGVGAMFLLMGLVVSTYGPLLDHLTRRFAVSLPVAGSTISIHFAGSLIGVFVAMRTMARLPARSTVMTAMAVTVAGALGIAFAPSWQAFVAAVFVIGIGFGALVISLNQVVAYSVGGRRAALLNGLNGAYSAGAVMGPLLVATLAVDHFSLLYVGVAALIALILPANAGMSGRLPVAAGVPGRPGRIVLIFVCAFVLYVGIENGTGGWMTSHLEWDGLRDTQAAAATSGFWLALMTGRLLMTLMPARVSERTIVLSASAAASLALLASTISPVAPVAYIAAGLAMAPIFPTSVVWLAKLRPDDARATSWLYPAASVGGIAGPGAIGLVIAGFGVKFVPLVLASVAIAMSIFFSLADRAVAKRP